MADPLPPTPVPNFDDFFEAIDEDHEEQKLIAERLGNIDTSEDLDPEDVLKRID